MPKGGKIVLALTPSRRVIGVALADRLGLIDTELCFLHELKSSDEILNKTQQWIDSLLIHRKPDVVVIEKLPKVRFSRKTRKIIKCLKSSISEICAKEPIFVKKKESVHYLVQSKLEKPVKLRSNAVKKGVCILAKHFSQQAPELAYHNPPTEKHRINDWYRTWGQAVSASALAIYIKDKLLT